MRSRITFLAMMLSFSIAHAQETRPTVKKDTRSFSERIWFGGGVGLSFGTVTAIQLDPMLGYKVDEEGKFTVGAGASYWYLRDNRFASNNTLQGYGYRPFLRYRFIEQAYAHAEFLHMNVDAYNYITDRTQRLWVPHVLVGGGYVQPLGGRSSIFLQVLFEVLQDPNSIYRNQGPILGGGIGIGF
ncbi:MAG: hypothetical protein IPO05_00385 [Flavobacteriales bacterium]|jgi:hypothetical protein|nr:hypothetical protein [Flavobacteriales bacterium]MBP7450032.1 hypothetical protein [Flavobacteriales bacterium]HOZ41346.1 hypothetical protein [Flavobacteriales bacterium]